VEVLTNYGSEIIALCALVFTVWHARAQRIHNQLTLKPHLDTFTERNKSDNVGRIEIQLINNGLGPAFIESFEVLVGDEVYEAKFALEALLGPRNDIANYTVLGNGYAIAHNQKVMLLALTFPVSSWADIDKMENDLESLNLKIIYKSVHGKTHTFDSRNG